MSAPIPIRPRWPRPRSRTLAAVLARTVTQFVLPLRAPAPTHGAGDDAHQRALMLALHLALEHEVQAFDAGDPSWCSPTNEVAPGSEGGTDWDARAVAPPVRAALRRSALAGVVEHGVPCSLVEAQLLVSQAVAAVRHLGDPARAIAPASPLASPGAVYWVCGLSGAGKTTFARYLVAALRAHHAEYRRHDCDAPVLLDGDALRLMLTGTPKYDGAARRWMGRCYATLARRIASGGADVVCAAISPFADVRRWQRAVIPRYREVWVRAPLHVLRGRDPKGLYRAAESGAVANVVGVDLAFEAPTTAEHFVHNVGSRSALRAAAREVARHVPAGIG